MSRLQLAIDQVTLARNYTRYLLNHVKPDDWFRQPPAGITHIAWQVGHLAMAEYRLCLERIRGERPEDAVLIPPDFLALFRRETVPCADPSRYPSVEKIQQVFDHVHQQVLRELPLLDDSDLDHPIVGSHPIAKTKLLALLWCAQHEGVHAGQIGLLRRQLGYPPIW